MFNMKLRADGKKSSELILDEKGGGFFLIYKVIYKTAGFFSLKKYNDSHLNGRSYEYPMAYTIRGAILSSVIQLEGIEKAKELFYKIKNAILYIQYPREHGKASVKLKLASNSYYDEKKTNNEEGLSSVGVREFVDVESIVFYIDNSIPNLKTYLNNIECIGDSQSLVYLESIEAVKRMENVLMEWVEERDGNADLFELYDWKTGKIRFEDVYLFSEKRSRRQQERKICFVKETVTI